MSGLLVVGASGHARVVAEAALQAGHWDNVAFADDRWEELDAWQGLPVVSSSKADPDLISTYPNVVVAIGEATTRLRLLREFATAGFEPVTVIHPASTLSASAAIGPGSVLLAGAIVNAGATLGTGCIVNTGGCVDHDCTLGDGVHVCPGAAIAGEVTIGDRTWIGIGSSVIQGVSIGYDVTVGAGSAVINDLAPGVTAVGVPARPVEPAELPA